MPLFPLDAVRNATIDRQLELVLEDVREDVALSAWGADTDMTVDDALAVYDLARPRLNILASLLMDLRGSRGADISTGLGFLPVLLGRLGLETAATELDVRTARFAEEHGVRVLPYRLGRDPVPFEPGSLDFVVFAEVLEHLRIPPTHALRPLAELLRPGGRLLLTTPNIARLDHIQALASGENFLEPFPEALPLGSDATDYVEHVREYSVREVVEALEACGLAVEQVLMTGWGEAGYDLLPNPFVNEICVAVAIR